MGQQRLNALAMLSTEKILIKKTLKISMNLSLNILLLPRKDEWTLHIKQCNLDNKGYFNIKCCYFQVFFLIEN
jgi:hypothetical protein